jgi:pyrimidine operon attenuation protein/uracil phosphoribosyltransferase
MHNEYDEADVGRMIGQLVNAVRAEFPADRQLNIVGIRTRGETLADRMAKALAAAGYPKLGRGVLDITLYRDDLSEIGPRPLVRPTVLDLPIDGNPLVLIDDVLFTGRSVRAALGAIADYGRPSAVRLAVLVDRGGRELPIQPDYVALKLPEVPRTHRVKVKLCENDRCNDAIVVEPRNAPNN